MATPAYIQVSAALPFLSQTHESLVRWYVADVIVGGPFRPRNDVVAIPTGPGLGVELDSDGLSSCAEDFERSGELSQLDTGKTRYRHLRRQ